MQPKTWLPDQFPSFDAVVLIAQASLGGTIMTFKYTSRAIALERFVNSIPISNLAVPFWRRTAGSACHMWKMTGCGRRPNIPASQFPSFDAVVLIAQASLGGTIMTFKYTSRAIALERHD